MANREPEIATRITAAELQGMAETFEAASRFIKDASLVAQKTKDFSTYNVKSGNLAIDRIQAFCAALDKALHAVRIGKPFYPGQLKERSTAKKSPQAAEIKNNLDAKRKATKKKPS